MSIAGFYFLHKGNIDVYSDTYYIISDELYALWTIAYGTAERKNIK